MKFLFLSLLPVAFGWDDVILPPPASKTGPTAALFFAQGADITTDAYEPILSKLQEALPFPLWVGVPQTPFDVAAIPLGLSTGISRIRKDMEKQGMPAVDALDFNFFGGHSLGGAMMPDYVNDNSDVADGQVLFGAFLGRKFRTGTTPEGRPQVEYPVSTLTVGGELDGLCRITRITEALYNQITFDADPKTAAEKFPVVVVEGMNHGQFSSGDMPSFVKNNDIQSEVAEDVAHSAVVQDVVNYLTSIVDGSGTSDLVSRVAESDKFVAHVTEALQMEGYEQFLPGCYCEAEDEYGGLQYGTCESSPACNGGVRWTGEYSQRIMAGLDEAEVKGLDITAVDSIHLVTEEKPSCHLPHIHGSDIDNANPGGDKDDEPALCDSPEGCTLELTTVTQHVYENSGEFDIWRAHFGVPWVDTGYLPITANELKTKIKSRQAIWHAAGVSDANYTQTDAAVEAGGEADRCGEINQAAVDWAFEQLPEKAQKRFQESGQQFVIGEDIGTCAAGPCWIWDPLRFKEDDEANTVTVQSVWFGTENHNNYPCGEGKLLPCSAGFHYCKLLSPARALEWMIVDGLKNVLGTNKV